MNTQKGVTLIELLIATGILALIVFALATIGASVMQAQSKANALQNLQDDLRFALEVAGKEIRLARVAKAGGNDSNCIATAGDSFIFTATSLRFINDRNECVRYQYDSGNQTFCRDVDKNLADGVSFPGSCTPIVSNQTQINSLQFVVTGQDQPNKQPRITLSLEAQNRQLESAGLELQVTLTQRELDVLKR